MPKNIDFTITQLDLDTGEDIALAYQDVPNGTGIFTLHLNGNAIGELHVLTDQDGRPSLALGQYDRRAHGWRAHSVITRRGAWIDEDEDGFHPVYDGRRIPGVGNFATEAEAQIAVNAIVAIKG